MKTKEEVEALKRNWQMDGIWDIETTEGFEDYKQELYIFRLECENKWMRIRLNKYDDAIMAIRELINPR